MDDKTEKIIIKNMVCNRCIYAVRKVMNELELKPVSVVLGEVLYEGNLTPEKKNLLDKKLKEQGFELLNDKKQQLIEKIKTEVINLIHYDKEVDGHVNISEYISKKLGYEYSYLSNLFSSIVGITIEKYIILQRIERVKELLVYDELSLSEIAWRTGYSSVQHLSNQFKKVIGYSPSFYKKMQKGNRKKLDQI